MKQSTFIVAKMDCPTEEQLIRNRLKNIEEIEQLDFDLMARELTITHRLDDDRRFTFGVGVAGAGRARKNVR